MKRMLKVVVLALSLAAASAVGAQAFENITPAEAYTLAANDANAYILDVRTLAEWQWVGHPGKNKLGEGAALAGKVVNISYQIENKGAMIINPSFLNEINELFGSNPNAVLIAMCRSGQRSSAAAAVLEAAGYRALNMVTGFQGGSDSSGYRTVNGWVNDGLPYTYSGAGYAD